MIPAGRQGKCGFERIHSEKSGGNNNPSASILNSSHMAERIALETFLRPWMLTEEFIKVNRPKTNHFVLTHVHFLYHDVLCRG